MSARKTRLVDCNPRLAQMGNRGPTRYLTFDCPEGHDGCNHAIPFTPSIEGEPQTSPQINGAQWQRTGETFGTLTLTPSIRALGPCFFHGFITNGEITFCGDSK